MPGASTGPILVLGATGLLGQAMVAEGRARGMTVRTAARSDAEIAVDIGDRDALATMLERERPALVANCAALVDIAACERDPGLAYRVNAAPLVELAGWSRRNGARLVHVSTDHYFTGDGAMPHGEDAPVVLMNHYAATKFAAEAFALTAPNALVLRTSIVGLRRRGAPTFAEWAIDAIETDAPITLFADAFTSSVDVGTFARAALDLAAGGASGLVNLAAREVYSKEAFIRALAERMGRTLTRATTGSIGALSPPRPESLGLDVARAEALLGRPLPTLKDVAEAVANAYRSSP